MSLKIKKLLFLLKYCSEMCTERLKLKKFLFKQNWKLESRSSYLLRPCITKSFLSTVGGQGQRWRDKVRWLGVGALRIHRVEYLIFLIAKILSWDSEICGVVV